MSDSKAQQRWEARRKAIADEFFAGDEAHVETVRDALPYSAIPDWGDVVFLVQSMSAAGLLATPEHDARVAAKALRDVADVLNAEESNEWADDADLEAVRIIELLRDRADVIEREGGASDG